MIKSACAFAAFAALLSAGPALAADAPAAPPTVQDYHPSFGDLMTMAVQPRHTKVGLALKDRNWAYLTYEDSELRNAFGRIARTIPTYRQSKLADLFASNILPTLDELDAAVKAKNGPAADAAYGKLTEACNACHMALDHAAVVIRAPMSSPYANQDFKPH